MSLKKPRLVLLVLITYHSLFGLPILDGETLETTASMDGTERLTTGIVIQGSDYSLGASYRFVPEYPNDFMLGLNTSLVSLGHLSDAGLASEVRNPGADALGRLSERTFYRSDVRSVSRSRIGIAVMPWDGRAGVSWERRENLNAGILWAVPVKTELFELEILGEAAHLMESEVDEGWYPDRDGTPAGSLGIAALRWRFDFEKYVLGMSSIVSAGSGFRPGMLCSLSMGVSEGPWRIRSRSIYSTPYFRSAEGDRTECRVESAMDWRRRPAHGFRFGVDYHAGSHRRFPAGHQFEDEGRLSFGWKLEFPAARRRHRLESNRIGAVIGRRHTKVQKMLLFRASVQSGRIRRRRCQIRCGRSMGSITWDWLLGDRCDFRFSEHLLSTGGRRSALGCRYEVPVSFRPQCY
jgi:hypothetical protein